MAKLKFNLAFHSYNSQRQNQLIQSAIKTTLSKKGIVISHAITAKEICDTENYNQSVELPVRSTNKF